jgi:hypothetical protein
MMTLGKTEAMTPPTARLKNERAPPPSRYRPGRSSKQRTVLDEAQDTWRKVSARVRNLNVPYWYAGLHGVPNWLLRQSIPSIKMDEKRRGLSLLVRMNYILDFHYKFRIVDRQASLFLLPARRILSFSRSFGPLYDYESGSYRLIIGGTHMNTSYALSSDYNWKRALRCTVGNFVHLLSIAALQDGGRSIADLAALCAAHPLS